MQPIASKVIIESVHGTKIAKGKHHKFSIKYDKNSIQIVYASNFAVSGSTT